MLEASATVSDAARAMKARDVGDVLVRSDGKLFGIVTDRDLVVRALAGDSKAIRRIPIVDDGRPVGIVSLGDLAVARDRSSALGKISAAAPTQ